MRASIFLARAMKPRLGLLVALAILAFPTAGAADIAGAGSDETASQAYGPLQVGVAYSGAFVSPSDDDYLSFVVSQAGETLQFTVQNTTRTCQDPYDAGCPVYATLMDTTGQNQVGGDNSDAGTIATVGDTETFAWTFAQPGTYYVLMESDGDLPAGSPSYSLKLTGGSGSGSSGGSGGSGGSRGSGGSHGPGSSGAGTTGSPLVRSLKVLPHQRGSAVAVTLGLSRATPWVRVKVFHAHGRGRPGHGRSRSRPVASRTFHHLRAGRHRLVLRLPSADRRKLGHGGRLSLILRITVATASGPPKRYMRAVILTK